MGSALGHGVWAFLKHYLFKQGYRDGWAGFIIALGNFEGTFYRYAKRYEEMQAWPAPPTAPLRRPSPSPAAAPSSAVAPERAAPTSLRPQ
jgi:hypothetical protein